MTDTIETPALDAGYASDFYLWTQQQAGLIRAAARHRANWPIDWENIAEEIESSGDADRQKVKSLALQIMIHLIKLQVSNDSDSRNGWKKEITAWRNALQDVLDDSPSLRAHLAELAESEWGKAVEEAQYALKEEELDANTWSALVFLKLLGPKSEHLLDRRFFPERSSPQ